MNINKNETVEFGITLEQISIKKTKFPQLSGLSNLQFSFAPMGRKDLPVRQFEVPVDWNMDPFNDNNWCAQLHMWRMLDPYLAKYEETGCQHWLQLPVKIICDWHDYYSNGGLASRHVWSDMQTGLRASKLAYILSQCYIGKLNILAGQHAKLMFLVEQHIGFLCDYKNIAMSNHTFFDMVGLGALAQVVDPKVRSHCYEILDNVVPKLALTQFDQYGVHQENSPGYHPFGIACLRMLNRTGWFPAANTGQLLLKAKDAFHWFLLPDGRVLPFGATTHGRQDWSLNKSNYVARNQIFNKSGYVVIRHTEDENISSASYLALMGALNSKFHKQSDDLTIFWFEGEDILTDVGKYAYKNDIFRNYALSTRAHNTVEIDQDNYYQGRIDDESLYGSAIRSVSTFNWGHLIEASVIHKRFGVRHTRWIMYQPRQFLVVIDYLDSDKVHEYTQWFHFASHLELCSSGSSVYTQLKSGLPFSLTHFSTYEAEMHILKGQTKPVIQGWTSEEYAKVTPNYAVGYSLSATKAVHASCMNLGRNRTSVQSITDTKVTVCVEDSGYMYQFVLSVDESNTQGERRFLGDKQVNGTESFFAKLQKNGLALGSTASNVSVETGYTLSPLVPHEKELRHDDNSRTISWPAVRLEHNSGLSFDLPAGSHTILDGNDQLVWIEVSNRGVENEAPLIQIKSGDFNHPSLCKWHASVMVIPMFYWIQPGIFYPVGSFCTLPLRKSKAKNGVIFKKSGDTASIVVKGAEKNSIEFNLKHNEIPFSDSLKIHQLDLWRLQGCWEVGPNRSRLRDITNSGEWEATFRTSGSASSTGGYHGNELLVNSYFVHGEKIIASGENVNEQTMDKIRLVQESVIFKPGVKANNIKSNGICRHFQDYTFTAEGIELIQKFVWLEPTTLVAGWITMLPILRDKKGIQITDRAVRSSELGVEDISKFSLNGIDSQKYTPVSDGDFVHIWGRESGVSAIIQFVETPNVPTQKVYISSASIYNKLYFNIRGDAKAGDAPYKTKAGEVWRMITKYKVLTLN